MRIRKDRQLAAVLFTDIVGFTKMMGSDEDNTLQTLERNRKIQKKWIRKFRGKWLKEMGGGSLVIFYTATEAVLCGQKILEVIKDEDFEVRIGIHVSEILFTDSDVFGDGVNVT